jgi:hypothetical protein
VYGFAASGILIVLVPSNFFPSIKIHKCRVGVDCDALHLLLRAWLSSSNWPLTACQCHWTSALRCRKPARTVFPTLHDRQRGPPGCYY